VTDGQTDDNHDKGPTLNLQLSGWPKNRVLKHRPQCYWNNVTAPVSDERSPLGLSSHLSNSTTSLPSCVSSTGWRLRIKLLSRVHCTVLVYKISTGQHPQGFIPYRRVLWGGRCRGSSATSGLHLFFISCTRLSTVGDQAFPVAAARVWNSLLEHVTSATNSVAVFRSWLKTNVWHLIPPPF